MSTSTLLDRIFAAHLSGTAHGYATTNTPETPTLEELCCAVADTDRWYSEYLEQLSVPPLRDIFTVCLHRSEPARCEPSR